MKTAFQRGWTAFANAGFSAIFIRAMYLRGTRDSHEFLRSVCQLIPQLSAVITLGSYQSQGVYDVT